MLNVQLHTEFLFDKIGFSFDEWRKIEKDFSTINKFDGWATTYHISDRLDHPRKKIQRTKKFCEKTQNYIFHCYCVVSAFLKVEIFNQSRNVMF